MPSGKVKFFNADKGFGFVSNDEGDDVYVHRDALPDGLTELKPGQRVEYGVVTGRKGIQAMQVRVLDPLPSVVRATRKPAEEMAPLVEDLIKLLDSISNSLPTRPGHSRRSARTWPCRSRWTSCRTSTRRPPTARISPKGADPRL